MVLAVICHKAKAFLKKLIFSSDFLNNKVIQAMCDADDDALYLDLCLLT